MPDRPPSEPPNEFRARYGCAGPRRLVLLVACVVVGVCGLASPLLAQQVRPGRGAPGAGAAGLPLGRIGGPPAELEVVERFDADGDQRLDAAERARALDWLVTYRPAGGVGGRGGTGIVTGTPGVPVRPEDVATWPDADLYDAGTLRTFFIEFESDDWERELELFYDTDVEVPATVVLDGRTYPDVGVHFRGASSFRMVPRGSKRPLNLSFDQVHDEQDVDGYQTVNLLNGSGDPTMVRAALYAYVAAEYVPVPQVNLVRVVINGENWGVYASAQQFNKDFLDDFFESDDGRRWKAPGRPAGRAGLEYLGDDPAVYRRLYEIKSSDDPESWAELIRLCRVLAETPLRELEAALEPILNVDGALRFLALEVALANHDGYWARASDYNLYQDPSGRFHVIPHDFNEALGAHGGEDLDPLVALDDPTKPLRSRLLRVPSLRERYLAYVRDIAERWLDPNALRPVAEAYRELIADDVAIDTRKLYGTEAFGAGFDDMYRFLERRRAYLLR